MPRARYLDQGLVKVEDLNKSSNLIPLFGKIAPLVLDKNWVTAL